MEQITAEKDQRSTKTDAAIFSTDRIFPLSGLAIFLENCLVIKGRRNELTLFYHDIQKIGCQKSPLGFGRDIAIIMKDGRLYSLQVKDTEYYLNHLSLLTGLHIADLKKISSLYIFLNLIVSVSYYFTLPIFFICLTKLSDYRHISFYIILPYIVLNFIFSGVLLKKTPYIKNISLKKMLSIMWFIPMLGLYFTLIYGARFFWLKENKGPC